MCHGQKFSYWGHGIIHPFSMIHIGMDNHTPLILCNLTMAYKLGDIPILNTRSCFCYEWGLTMIEMWLQLFFHVNTLKKKSCWSLEWQNSTPNSPSSQAPAGASWLFFRGVFSNKTSDIHWLSAPFLGLCCVKGDGCQNFKTHFAKGFRIFRWVHFRFCRDVHSTSSMQFCEEQTKQLRICQFVDGSVKGLFQMQC